MVLRTVIESSVKIVEQVFHAGCTFQEASPVKDGKHAFTLYPDWANNNTNLRPPLIKFLKKHLKN